jgi:hypothetical protein
MSELRKLPFDTLWQHAHIRVDTKTGEYVCFDEAAQELCRRDTLVGAELALARYSEQLEERDGM